MQASAPVTPSCGVHVLDAAKRSCTREDELASKRARVASPLPGTDLSPEPLSGPGPWSATRTSAYPGTGVHVNPGGVLPGWHPSMHAPSSWLRTDYLEPRTTTRDGVTRPDWGARDWFFGGEEDMAGSAAWSGAGGAARVAAATPASAASGIRLRVPTPSPPSVLPASNASPSQLAPQTYPAFHIAPSSGSAARSGSTPADADEGLAAWGIERSTLSSDDLASGLHGRRPEAPSRHAAPAAGDPGSALFPAGSFAAALSRAGMSAALPTAVDEADQLASSLSPEATLPTSARPASVGSKREREGPDGDPADLLPREPEAALAGGPCAMADDGFAAGAGVEAGGEPTLGPAPGAGVPPGSLGGWDPPGSPARRRARLAPGDWRLDLPQPVPSLPASLLSTAARAGLPGPGASFPIVPTAVARPGGHAGGPRDGFWPPGLRLTGVPGGIGRTPSRDYGVRWACRGMFGPRPAPASRDVPASLLPAPGGPIDDASPHPQLSSARAAEEALAAAPWARRGQLSTLVFDREMPIYVPERSSNATIEDVTEGPDDMTEG